MTQEKYQRFDAADYIKNADDSAFLLEAALEDSVEDSSALPVALGIIARSGNLSELARRVGMSRDGLYRALSEDGNPTWSTILKVTQALDIRLEMHLAHQSA
ncbi:MAG: addiction module antidote protein [Ancrocorticia sp.]|uniref:addiction module antidote protein n=1 Tax=Ancrocorticia sp. TaxID=2593684 RepID=UPI003F90D242